MTSDIERKYLIDRYLKGELSGLALDEFKNRLKIDPEFNAEVESQRAIIEGIKMARREHLLAILKGEIQPDSIAVPKISETPTQEKSEPKKVIIPIIPETPEVRFTPNYNNWYFAAAAVLFAGFFMYFIFGYYIPHQNKIVDLPTKTEQSSKTETIIKDHPKDDTNSTTIVENPVDAGQNDSLPENNDVSPIAPSNNDKPSLDIAKDTKTGENRLLITTLETIAGSENIIKDPNVNAGNGDKTAPVGDFKVKRTKSTQLKIEYWHSIVNFKGYKLSNGNLQLFDVNADDKINLKYLDKQLYLKRNDHYYKLNSSGNFESFQKENNPEIINILETN
jgi:hypothetical protein